MSSQKRYVQALTIAGSDSGGGAGIQADIKTFSALGCYATSVLTALTAQNTVEVKSIFEISSAFVEDQLNAVLSDIEIDAVKIGMLLTPDNIEVVARCLKNFGLKNIVLDPVMVAKSGDLLLRDESIFAMEQLLFPMVQVMTPNIPESSILLQRAVLSERDMEAAAQDLALKGPSYVVIKGGHFNTPQSRDVIYCKERAHWQWIESERIQTKNNHGTGCTFSSAIAAYLAHGYEPLEAIFKAKKYLSKAIQEGASYAFGSGHGPVHHFHQFWQDTLP